MIHHIAQIGHGSRNAVIYFTDHIADKDLTGGQTLLNPCHLIAVYSTVSLMTIDRNRCIHRKTGRHNIRQRNGIADCRTAAVGCLHLEQYILADGQESTVLLGANAANTCSACCILGNGNTTRCGCCNTDIGVLLPQRMRVSTFAVASYTHRKIIFDLPGCICARQFIGMQRCINGIGCHFGSGIVAVLMPYDGHAIRAIHGNAIHRSIAAQCDIIAKILGCHSAIEL